MISSVDMSSAMDRASKPVERVFSLITTLVREKEGLNRAQIFQRLEEHYGDGSIEARRRMFLRDKDLAAELGFSIKTEVREDLASEDEKHVYLIDGEELPRLEVTLNDTQRQLLVATADTVLDDPAFPLREEMAVAVHKVLLASGPQAGEDACSCRLMLQERGGVARSGARRWMTQVTRAVEKRERIRIRYEDREGRITQREIDPWGIAFVWGEWRLAAMCHLRDAVRVFALHRIQDLRFVRRGRRQVRFRVPAGVDPVSIIHVMPWQYSVHEPVEVTLRADGDFAWYARRFLGVDPGEGTEDVFSLRATNTDFLVSMVLRYGPRLRILEPESLVREVATRARQVGSRRGWGRAKKGPLVRRRQAGVLLARRPEPDTKKRLALFSFIVMYVAEHGQVRLSDLAKILDMDVSRLVTMLEKVATCGVYPSWSHDLYGIVVSEDEGIVTYTGGPSRRMERPVRLEEREMAGLVLGLKWLTDCTTPPFDYEADRIVRKFLDSAGRQLRNLSEDLMKRIRVGGGRGPDWDTFLDVSRAVLDRRKVDITYYTISRGEESRRTIRPYVVVSRLGMWYVVAHCEKVGRVRTFRFDRIRSHRLRTATFLRPRTFDPARYLDWGIYPDPDPPPGQRTVVAFDPRWLGRNVGREGYAFLDHVQGNQLTFAVDPTAHEGFLSWLLGLTTRFAILEPPALVARMRDRGKALVEAHSSV